MYSASTLFNSCRFLQGERIICIIIGSSSLYLNIAVDFVVTCSLSRSCKFLIELPIYNLSLCLNGRETRLADYNFKMTESNLCKTGFQEKESFRVFFGEGKVHHLVLKDKIPGPPIEIPGYFPLPFDSGVLMVAGASKIIEGFFLKY